LFKFAASLKTVHDALLISHERFVFTEYELPEFKDMFEIIEARKKR
jgi:hypothetical protein